MNPVPVTTTASPVQDALAGPFARTRRIDSVDLLRGVVMLIMGLDHTREFFTYLTFQPENMERSFPALFFTRWITHFCAPVFFLLAGTGAFLSMRNGRSLSSLTHFLWTRGLWLIVLELTLGGFAFTFSWRYHLGVVIWALGWSMIVLALLLRLRPAMIAVFAGALILFHNLFDSIRPVGESASAWVIAFLHAPKLSAFPNGHVVGLLYPLVPWIAVTAAGYLLGYVYTLDAARRRRLLLGLGFVVTLAFVALRATNWYGEPRSWTHQPSAIMTVCSFLNCTKYPPSLCFLLMTLGPALIFLGLVDGRRLRLGAPIVVYGRVPLFFFILHLYLVHLLAITVAFAYRQPVDWLFHGAVMANRPPGYGHGLPFVYLIWAIAMLILYPVCRWYAALKRRSSNPLLSYL
jgi:uncharacterized membrane protein